MAGPHTHTAPGAGFLQNCPPPSARARPSPVYSKRLNLPYVCLPVSLVSLSLSGPQDTRCFWTVQHDPEVPTLAQSRSLGGTSRTLSKGLRGYPEIEGTHH